MISDDDLAVTCIGMEAGNQPHEGRVAVGIVILNRKRLCYSSDGTMIGTVLHRWAFSWAWAQMQHGVYTQTSFTLDQAEVAAEDDYAVLKEQAPWADYERAWADAQAWASNRSLSFAPGPAFKGLTPHTVLYLNPKLSKAPWATPEDLDATIFDHAFFRDPGFKA